MAAVPRSRIGCCRKLGVACFLFAYLCGGRSALVLAQSTEPAGSRVEQLISLGMERRQAGRDAEALEAYQEAAAIDPDNARVLAHLGVTYQALGRWVSASVYLTQALAYRDEPFIRSHQSELKDALTVVEGHLGRLEVYGGPPGAETYVNGQLVGRLPMAHPVPMTVGTYLLEVRASGHYALSRPINITPRALTREEVQLSPQQMAGEGETVDVARPGTANRVAPKAAEMDDGSSAPSWLPWVLAGSSGVALGTTIVAWRVREHYVDRWNDDDLCLALAGVSREERCGSDFDRGKRAENVAWVSGAAGAALAAGAVISALLADESSELDEPPGGTSAAPAGCMMTLAGAACFGTF